MVVRAVLQVAAIRHVVLYSAKETSIGVPLPNQQLPNVNLARLEDIATRLDKLVVNHAQKVRIGCLFTRGKTS